MTAAATPPVALPAAVPAHAPATLDAAGIAARIPHRDAMCLLERLESWSPEGLRCSTSTHLDPHNPLRTPSGLLAPAAIEYAAQAMALHGSLVAPADGGPGPGYLASVRGVRFAGARLDAVAGRLQVEVERLAGDSRQILYRFVVGDGATVFAEGRATVVLNTPLDLSALAVPAAPGTDQGLAP
jgi:predicted hotdog family 3-hydroxylacyl-ACP dehydratase